MIINHISSQDEIGKLGVHIGTTIIYDRDGNTGTLSVYESDDYGLIEVLEDQFGNKVYRTIKDGKSGLSHHGIKTFEPYLKDGELRRDDDD